VAVSKRAADGPRVAGARGGGVLKASVVRYVGIAASTQRAQGGPYVQGNPP
jgi:hypothetical protein